MIAIKFNKDGNYISHCVDAVKNKEQIKPNSEGFEFYDIELAAIDDIFNLKLVNGVIVKGDTK